MRNILRSHAVAVLSIIITAMSFSALSSAVTEKVLYSFSGGNDGSAPVGDLVFDSLGNAYGTTQQGGPNDSGTVFQLTPNPDGTWTKTTLYSFTGGNDDSQRPDGGLLIDAAGNLYGTTLYGGPSDSGTVFELKANGDGTWSESVIHSFRGTPGGTNPLGALAIDTHGTMYGVTNHGGTYNLGTVFMLRQIGNNWSKSTLYNFTGQLDGSYLLTITLNGAALYGSTSGGGAYNNGTVFRLTKTGGQVVETTLYNFTGGLVGQLPTGSIVFKDGNIYGALASGGAYNVGTIYQLTPAQSNWSIHILHTLQAAMTAVHRVRVWF